MYVTIRGEVLLYKKNKKIVILHMCMSYNIMSKMKSERFHLCVQAHTCVPNTNLILGTKVPKQDDFNFNNLLI